jgi:hypothetical protein
MVELFYVSEQYTVYFAKLTDFYYEIMWNSFSAD